MVNNITLDGVDQAAFDYYPVLRRLSAFVRAHLEEPISLDRAAGVVGLEPKYLSAFFRQKAGLCYTEWLRGLRIQKAIELLDRSDQRITDLAFTVGFQDLRTFERWFKRSTGFTPRDYRAVRRLRPASPDHES